MRDEDKMIEGVIIGLGGVILLILTLLPFKSHVQIKGLIASCVNRPPFAVKNWHYSPDEGWRFVTPEGRIIQSTYACEVSDDYVSPASLSKP